MNLYRIYFSDGNDRDEFGRVTAKDINQAKEYALKQYFQEDLEYEEDGFICEDEEILYLRIDSCKYCDKEELMQINDIEDEDELCEYCEISEYIEIFKDNQTEKEYKTIFGINEYANLEEDIKPVEYNPMLAKAWRIDPKAGCNELIYSTIEDNPKMVQGIDKDYLKDIIKTHLGLTKEEDKQQ